MRKVLLAAAALLAAVVFFVFATLPRPERVASTLDPGLQRRTVAGAYHVHSTRSDGAGTKDAIAAAASRAGLAFVILTDHGDGTRAPDQPEYLHGVLCVDAVEISTTGGHYVALGMRAAPYPLGGEPSAVVEDVHRLGGFGIAAHPDSPRAELAWTDWTAPIDGIEWLSADSEWRDESRTTLARVLVGYALRPASALASMLDRPVATLRRWDSIAATRPIVGLAAHDAHGGIGRGVEDGGARRRALGGVPSYEGSFSTFSNRVILDAPLTGDARADAARLLEAIEHGRVFTVVDAIATPGYLEVNGSDGTSSGSLGSVLGSGSGSVTVDASMPARAQLVAVQDGREIVTDPGQQSGHRYASAPGAVTGAIRFEIRVPRAPGTPPVPWLVSNPIYFLPPGIQPASRAGEPHVALQDTAAVDLPANAGWRIERDPHSRAALSASRDRVTLDFTLAPGARASQFAAFAIDLHAPAERFSLVRMVASADRPGRLSIQLRYPQGGGARWGSSRYVDATPRELAVAVDRMRPLDRQTDPPADPAAATALLVVVDLTNARPGDSNVVRLSHVRLAR